MSHKRPRPHDGTISSDDEEEADERERSCLLGLLSSHATEHNRGLPPPPSHHNHSMSTTKAPGGGGGTNKMHKAIVHIDIDAAYVAFEEELDPSLKGLPVAVVQYSPTGNLSDLKPTDNRRVDSSDQSIIAVNYTARAHGVKRIMTGNQARAVCPNIALVQVCVRNKKADLTIYRQAGGRVVKIFARYGPTERASIDEAYTDLTAAAQTRMPDFSLEMIAKARQFSKLGGLEGQEEQVSLTKEDLRNGYQPPTAAVASATAAEAEAETATATTSKTTDQDDGGGKEEATGAIKTTFTTATAAEATTQSTSTSTSTNHANANSGNYKTPLLRASIWWERPLSDWTTGERLMVCGACILAEMRQAVTSELGYTCSGGLASSKLLAKLGSGMNKPNGQTLIVQEMIPLLLGPLPVARLKGLGGNFGEQVQKDLECTTIGEVVETPLSRLEQLYGASTGDWLYKLVRGVDDVEVEDRTLAKSVSCGKTFYGGNNLRTIEQVHQWLEQLAQELTERLQGDASTNERIPQLLTVSFQGIVAGGGGGGGHGHGHGHGHTHTHTTGPQNVSRSTPVRVSIEQLEENPGKVQATFADLGAGLVRKWQRENSPNFLCLATLYLTAGNFLEIKQKSRMTNFFAKAPADSAGAGGDAGAAAAVAASSSPSSSTAATAPLSSSSSSHNSNNYNTNTHKRKGRGGGIMDAFLQKGKTEESGVKSDTTEAGHSAPAPSAPAATAETAATAATAATALSEAVDLKALLAAQGIDPEVFHALPSEIQQQVLAGISMNETIAAAEAAAAKSRKKTLVGYFGKKK